MNTILKVGSKSLPVEQLPTLDSIWFWIAIIELLLIFLLLYKLKSKKNKSQLSDFEKKNIKNSRNNEIDMDNLMNSIHNSRTLYKELSKKCHPDRFVNHSKQKISEEIFQEISKNERNFDQLNLLKSRAITELNITF
jgi:hypothetical protein